MTHVLVDKEDGNVLAVLGELLERSLDDVGLGLCKDVSSDQEDGDIGLGEGGETRGGGAALSQCTPRLRKTRRVDLRGKPPISATFSAPTTTNCTHCRRR